MKIERIDMLTSEEAGACLRGKFDEPFIQSGSPGRSPGS
jgi:hypothetical protein